MKNSERKTISESEVNESYLAYFPPFGYIRCRCFLHLVYEFFTSSQKKHFFQSFSSVKIRQKMNKSPNTFVHFSSGRTRYPY
jgi:hypothetical protein